SDHGVGVVVAVHINAGTRVFEPVSGTARGHVPGRRVSEDQVLAVRHQVTTALQCAASVVDVSTRKGSHRHDDVLHVDGAVRVGHPAHAATAVAVDLGGHGDHVVDHLCLVADDRDCGRKAVSLALLAHVHHL